MLIQHGIFLVNLWQTMDELNKTRSILNTILICARKMLLCSKFETSALQKEIDCRCMCVPPWYTT